MKRIVLSLAALAAVTGVALYSAAQEGERRDQPQVRREGGDRPADVRREGDVRKEGGDREGDASTPALRGEYARMAEVCGLTEEQRNKIAALIAARDKEVREVTLKYQARIAAVFTDPQRALWNETLLLTSVQRLFQRANLTEDQLARVKAVVAAQAKDQSLNDNRTRSQVLRKVVDAVNKDVLTNQQRAALREGDRRDAPRGEGDRRDAPRGEGDRPEAVRPDGDQAP